MNRQLKTIHHQRLRHQADWSLVGLPAALASMVYLSSVIHLECREASLS
jgi:hypothetical protein